MDIDAPLREDVKLLGRLLGETLAEQNGAAALAQIEDVRKQAREARRADGDIGALTAQLSALSDAEGLFVARAFAHFLALANIAEQHHRVRRLDQRHDEAEALNDTVARLCAQFGKDAVHRSLSTQVVELVLTAHPTEVSRRTILQKFNRIAALLDARDRAHPAEQRGMQESLRVEIEALWLTDEIRRVPPTPEEEARGGWVVIEQSVWQALPRFWRALDAVLLAQTGRGLPAEAVPIRFASWMGGDRDGNPNVTAAITREICLLARWLAADLYLRDVEALRLALSMNACSPELRRAAGEAHEPYRAVLTELRERLRETRTDIERALKEKTLPAHFLTSEDILAPLLLCDRSLRACKAEHVANAALLDTIRRVRCFGAGLLRLDLRQESTRHTQALSEMTDGDYEKWNETERQAFLLRELDHPSTFSFSASADTQEVFDTFAVAAKFGEASLGAYVISMTRQASDVLAVAYLQKRAGISPPLRIVPLFETIADLQAAEATLQQLFELPWYRAFCGERQEVMIGYSDSAKDRGRLMAAFALYEAQERVAKLAEEKKIALTFFHGRGGSVGRGGGSTTLAIASQAAGTVQGRLRVTEQGEMIQAKFALPGVAFRTLEIYCAATLDATLAAPPPPHTEWRTAMTKVCARAAEVYEQTIKNDPSFIPYFREATPIEELSTLNIGSRPARRKALQGVSGLRAIPWVFSWTQTRLHLPVWLGLAQGFAEVDVATLQTMYKDWPFFRAVIDLIAMVLAKAEPQIAAHYDALLVAPELQPLGETLRAQLGNATRAVLAVMQSKDLLEGNGSLTRAIEVRNPYIDPLNLLQAEFLRRARAGNASPTLHDALLISVNGIANGMRNTG